MSTTCCATARFDPTLRQGETWRQGIRLREKATQAVYDLSGHSARVVVRRQNATGEIVAELTSADDEVTIDTELGRIEWALAMNFPVGKYAYSLQITDAGSGDDDVPVWGTITLEADPNYTPA
jgi:hypothetical protein